MEEHTCGSDWGRPPGAAHGHRSAFQAGSLRLVVPVGDRMLDGSLWARFELHGRREMPM